MKHIVFVIGNYKNGGVAMHATNLANQFSANGYFVTLLVTKEIANDTFFSVREKVEVVLLKEYAAIHEKNNVVQHDFNRRNRKRKFYKYLRTVLRTGSRMDRKFEQMVRGLRRSSLLRTYLLLNQNAIIIPFGIECYEMSYFASRGLKVKLIYAERNAAELECPSDLIEKKYVFDILRKADAAVLQTQNEIEFYKDCFRKNAEVIHNPIKENLPLPYHGDRRKIVVNFCRISKQKNLLLLIDAFRKIHEEFPEYILEIYGNAVEKNEEEQREELIQTISKNGENECIHILPPVADVHNRIKDCAMFVSSSDFEGLSNSMIEAMAIGMPCVCTDCLGGGAREVIKHKENGLLVPIRDKEALYLAMKQYILNPEFAEKCGENAIEINKAMSAEVIGNKWLDLIEGL